jgi:hypothetical protein
LTKTCAQPILALISVVIDLILHSLPLVIHAMSSPEEKAMKKDKKNDKSDTKKGEVDEDKQQWDLPHLDSSAPLVIQALDCCIDWLSKHKGRVRFLIFLTLILIIYTVYLYYKSFLNPCVFIRLPSFCPLVYPPK